LSEWNVQGLWQGWADPPLSKQGVQAAQLLVSELERHGFTRVACSDLARSAQTAEILAAGLGLGTPTIDDRLRERDVGEWAGMTDDEIEQRWPGQLDAWRADDLGAPAGGGEDAATVVARVRECIAGLLSDSGSQTWLIVTHIGAIRALHRALGGSGSAMGNLDGRWFEQRGTELFPTGDFESTAGERAEAGRL
jgi:probable phosphoglycerate mutase